MPKLTFVSLILSLAFIVGCQATQPAVTPATPTTSVVATKVEILPTNTILTASTEEPMPDNVKTAVATATLTAIPLPTETAMPTPLPTNTPIPDPVWSMLFTGRSCSKTATDCTEGQDMSPSMEYIIYSDGTRLRPFSEIEGIPHDLITVEFIVLSPDQSQVAFYSGDKFMLGDVGEDTYSEVAADIAHFYPFNFYGNDPDCLAGFDEQKEEGVITTKLYKSCIGDMEPTLIDTAIFPSEYTGLTYLLSPQGDKWLVYNRGVQFGDETTSLYTKEIDNSTSLQLIFQQQGVSCASAIHWQDNETIEFLYASCDGTHDRMTYFYVTDWEGKALTTRYELPALEVPHPVRASFYTVETGDWFSDNNLFVYSISRNGSPPPDFNGLFILNFKTGEVQQILSGTAVFAIRAWLPVTTNLEE